MGKNLMQRQRETEQAIYNAGFTIGVQWGSDLLQIALLEVGVSAPKIKAACIRSGELMHELRDGLRPKEAECDYIQEKIDSKLRKVWADELKPFEARYDYIKKCKY